MTRHLNMEWRIWPGHLHGKHEICIGDMASATHIISTAANIMNEWPSKTRSFSGNGAEGFDGGARFVVSGKMWRFCMGSPIFGSFFRLKFSNGSGF